MNQKTQRIVDLSFKEVRDCVQFIPSLSCFCYKTKIPVSLFHFVAQLKEIKQKEECLLLTWDDGSQTLRTTVLALDLQIGKYYDVFASLKQLQRWSQRGVENAAENTVENMVEEIGGELVTCEKVEDYDAITHHILACIHTHLILEKECMSPEGKQDSELDWFRHADEFCQSEEEFKEKQTAQVEAFNEIGQQALQECHAEPWIFTDVLPNPNSRLYAQSREEIRRESLRQRQAEKARLRALSPTSKKKKQKKKKKKRKKKRQKTKQKKAGESGEESGEEEELKEDTEKESSEESEEEPLSLAASTYLQKCAERKELNKIKVSGFVPEFKSLFAFHRSLLKK